MTHLICNHHMEHPILLHNKLVPTIVSSLEKKRRVTPAAVERKIK